MGKVYVLETLSLSGGLVCMEGNENKGKNRHNSGSANYFICPSVDGHLDWFYNLATAVHSVSSLQKHYEQVSAV